MEVGAQQNPADDSPIVNISGERVALGPRRREHLPLYERWFNDFKLRRTIAGEPRPITFEEFVRDYDDPATTQREITFTIYEIATWRPIGFCGLQRIDYRHRSAEFAIVIGEPEARGRGFGTEATRLTLDYAFTALGLHNVLLVVYSYNLAGVSAYRRAGFREIGRRHESHFMGGRLWDEIFMECLSSEFASPVLAQVFAPDQPR